MRATRETEMTISSATMPALLLACVMGLTSVAAAQDVRTAARTSHAKKQTKPAPQANTAPRGPSDADRWMDRASGGSNGGGGGGGY
jgi:hypothetical protein